MFKRFKRNRKQGLSRRDFLKLSAYGSAGALAGLYGGLSFAQDDMMAETADITFASYNINWANNVFNEVADHFGWLAEAGINSQEMSIVDQSQIFPALIGGSLMFGAQDTDAIANANLAGEPIKFIANYRNKEPWIFAVSAEIKTVEDLYGKTVSAGGAGGRNEWNSRTMIERLGGDPDQINWQPIGGGSDSRVNAFIEGQIDGVNMFDRHRPLVEDVGGRLIYDDKEIVPQDAFCVHQNFLDENPRTVIGFLKATTQARMFVADVANKDEVIEIMLARGYEFPQAFIDQYELQLDILNPTGQFNVAAMETLIADSVRTGSLEEEIDWHEFCDMSYLNTAFEELGLEPVDYEAGGEMVEAVEETEETSD
jgi:ABC-type nitrate/sulfonate/bicarbonate transport system substrate-binding protein